MTHKELASRIGDLVDKKSFAYGGKSGHDAVISVAKILGEMYPNGISVSQYFEACLMVRLLDKQIRIAKGDKLAFEESPWADIVGYGLRALMVDYSTKKRKK